MAESTHASIVRIETVNPPLCPLYEYVRSEKPIASTYRRTYFGSSSSELWSTGATDRQPCAVPAQIPEISLRLYLNGNKSLKTGTPWALNITLDTSLGKVAVKPLGGMWSPDSVKEGVIAKIPVPKNAVTNAVSLPWALVGSLSWEITGTGQETDSLVGKGTISIELYGISQYIPLFMKRDGIPLDLLRFPSLLPEWMKIDQSDKDLPLGWSSFVTSQLFHDPRMCYNSFIGQAGYCGSAWEGDSMDSVAVLWMDLWLSDMNGIEKRKSKEQYSVNCSDLATLTLAISSLGLKDDKSRLQICSVEKPFYINKTWLIGTHQSPDVLKFTGADACNNPFYSRIQGAKMVCPPKDPTRTYFSNHQFVVQGICPPETTLFWGEQLGKQLGNPRVLDSCAGPHLGPENLAQYISATVDNAAAASWKGKPGTAPKETVSVEDIEVNVRLGAMAPRPAIIRTISHDGLPASLYKKMTEMFSGGVYSVMEPLEGFTDPYSHSIVVTWTITEKSSFPDDAPPLEYHVNVSRYQNFDLVSQAYGRRKAKLKVGNFSEDVSGGKEANGPNGLRSNLNPGFYMFWAPVSANDLGPKTGQFYLVTIDGNFTGDRITFSKDSVGQMMWAGLKSLGEEEGIQKEMGIGGIVCPDTVILGDQFNAKIMFKEGTSTWWRGATGQPTGKSIMLLSAACIGASEEVASEGFISMTFQAIAEGDDMIKFSLYDHNLGWTQAKVKVKVVRSVAGGDKDGKTEV